MLDFRISSINSALRKVLIRLRYPLEVMFTCVRWYVAYPVSEVVRTVGPPRFDFHGFLLGFAQNGNQPQGMVHPNERWIERKRAVIPS